MLIELPKSDYELVRPFFKKLKYQLTTHAVLDGICPGEVFVDDIKSPNGAYMKTTEGYFLAGSPQNEGFLGFRQGCYYRLYKRVISHVGLSLPTYSFPKK